MQNSNKKTLFFNNILKIIKKLHIQFELNELNNLLKK